MEFDIPLYETSNKDFGMLKSRKRHSGESKSQIRKCDNLITQLPTVSTESSFVSNPPNQIGDGYIY